MLWVNTGLEMIFFFSLSLVVFWNRGSWRWKLAMGGSCRACRAKSTSFKSFWRGRVEWSASSRVSWAAPRSTAPYCRGSRPCSLTPFNSCWLWSTTAMVRLEGGVVTVFEWAYCAANIRCFKQKISIYTRTMFCRYKREMKHGQREHLTHWYLVHNYILHADWLFPQWKKGLRLIASINTRISLRQKGGSTVFQLMSMGFVV